jgi:hypothetical protein
MLGRYTARVPGGARAPGAEPRRGVEQAYRGAERNRVHSCGNRTATITCACNNGAANLQRLLPRACAGMAPRLGVSSLAQRVATLVVLVASVGNGVTAQVCVLRRFSPPLQPQAPRPAILRIILVVGNP